MLQLVLGVSGTGKSTYIFEEIRRRARQGQYSILMVPEQFTSSTESRIYHWLGDELSGYVASYSFTSLSEKLLGLYGGAAIPNFVVGLLPGTHAVLDILSWYVILIAVMYAVMLVLSAKPYPEARSEELIADA